jgi:YgiT-type zinc finger domain-containing protein
MDGRVQSEEVNMKCHHCRGELVRGFAPFHVDRSGCHVVLDTVPAWICRQCGEACFEEPEVDAIQDLIRSVEQNARKLAATG